MGWGLCRSEQAIVRWGGVLCRSEQAIVKEMHEISLTVGKKLWN